MIRIFTTICISTVVMVCQAASPKHETLRLEPVGGRPHPPVVTALAYSPQLKLLAAGGDDHAIRLLDMETKQVVRVLSGHDDWVRTLHFSPDGNLLVSAGNDTQVIIWNRSESWAPRQRLSDGPSVACVRFAPDGRTIATVGFRAQLDVLGTQTGQTEFNCGCTDLRAVAYSPDGRLIACAGRTGHLHLITAIGLQLVAEESLHAGRVRGIEFQANTSTFVSCAEDGSVCAYDCARRLQTSAAIVPSCKLYCISSLSNEIVAVGGSDNLIHLIDLKTNDLISQWEGHTGSVAAMVRCGDVLVTAGFDTTLRLWNLNHKNLSGDRVADSHLLRGDGDSSGETIAPR